MLTWGRGKTDMVSCLSCHVWACGWKTCEKCTHSVSQSHPQDETPPLQHLGRTQTGTSFVFLLGFVLFRLMWVSLWPKTVSPTHSSIEWQFFYFALFCFVVFLLYILSLRAECTNLLWCLIQPSFNKKAWAHCWLHKCSLHICTTKTRLIDIRRAWDLMCSSSWGFFFF